MKKTFKIISLLMACFWLPFLITSNIYKENSTQYIISEYNGKLAVFKVNSRLPQNIYNIYVSSFPDDEQRSLKKGIKINSDNELQDMLEAYLG